MLSLVGLITLMSISVFIGRKASEFRLKQYLLVGVIAFLQVCVLLIFAFTARPPE